ncbi:MAG: hypothetical protein Ct9H300mP13_3730 [Gammaproteobacteria bacterium]|nr:MAG: hypothetical protein Ct9H300mP13_3730 [Gammaproteobacteria bacterium]
MTIIHERRRRAIMDLMGEGIAIIPTAPESQRNSDVTTLFVPTAISTTLRIFLNLKQ